MTDPMLPWNAGLPPVPADVRGEMADELDESAARWEAGAGLAEYAYLRLVWPTDNMKQGQMAFDSARLVFAAAADVLGGPADHAVMAAVFSRGDGPAMLRAVADQLRGGLAGVLAVVR